MEPTLTENEITYLVRKAIFEVCKNLGPGLLESVYEKALIFELNSLGLDIQNQVRLPLLYKGRDLHLHFVVDFLINDKVILEIKSVEELTKLHHKQLINYLNLSGKNIGLLVNFNTGYIEDDVDLFRLIRNTRK